MPKRRLRYASAVTDILEKANTKHIFAQKHAMNVYAQGAIYSLIPKNACSTMRLSIAIENGCVKEAAQAAWIIPNTYTFSANLADLLRARYTFIILRCPYARLASCFMDKFTHGTVPAQKYLRAQPSIGDLNTLTFKQFCLSLRERRLRNLDSHWKPQVDFLVYDEYDDVFCVERLDVASSTLRDRIGLEVVDSRNYIKHGTDQYTKLSRTEKYAMLSIGDIKQMRKTGSVPHPESLFDDETKACLEVIYAEDFKVFGQHFPGVSLFTPVS